MKKVLTLLVVLLFCVGCEAQSLKASLKKAYNATAEVYTQLKPDGPWLGVGTGWLCQNRHTFITAKHVVNGFGAGGFGVLPWSGVKVKLSDNTFVNIDLSNIAQSASSDIAIMKIKQDVSSFFVPLQLETKDTRLGESVCGVGYPLSYDQIAFNGILTGETLYDNEPFLLTNAVINPGHSGSAVLNYNGKVIGMVIAKDRRTEAINYIMPSFLIKKELELGNH